MIIRSITLVTGCVLCLCGCVESGPRYYSVSGSVTLDGAPLPEGNILFTPTDTSLQQEPGTIKDGKYTLKALEGSKRVEISASKIIPGSRTRGAGGEPVPEEYLPSRYNMQSTLTAEVKKSGENVFSFQLESK